MMREKVSSRVPQNIGEIIEINKLYNANFQYN